jgi:hypothetical protein
MQDLDDKVRSYFIHDAVKHGLNGDQDLDEYVDEKINGLPNTELLFYISLALKGDE